MSTDLCQIAEKSLAELLTIANSDVEQIPQILVQLFSKCLNKSNQKIKQLKKMKYSIIEDCFDDYFEFLKILMFNAIEYEGIENFIRNNKENKKFICAKVISNGDTVWTCKDCALHPTCIICQECFDNSDHKGHRISMSRDIDGCCDCGDTESWKQSGFCCDHTGYSEESIEGLEQKMPQQMKINTAKVFEQLVLKMKVELIDFEDDNEDFTKHILIVRGIFKFIEWAIDLSPVYIGFLEKAILEDTPVPLSETQQKYHDECSLAYRNDENPHLKKHFDSLPEDESTDCIKYCTCSLFDLIFTRCYQDEKHTEDVISEILLKIIASSKLKLALACSYMANYDFLMEQFMDIGKSSLVELNTEHLASFITGKILSMTEEGNDDPIVTEELYQLMDDLKLMALPKAIQYLANETDFIETLLTAFQNFQNYKPVEKQSQHIEYEEGAFEKQFEDMDVEVVQYLKILLAGLDMKNEDRNKLVFRQFILSLQQSKEGCRYDNADFGYFMLPIHKSFGFYITRFVMYQYLLNENENKNDMIKFRNLVIDKIKSYLDPDQSLDQILRDISQPLTHALKFLLHIKSNYWVLSGEIIQDLYDDIYIYKTTSLYLYLALFQMLIFLSDEKDEFMQNILSDLDLLKVHEDLSIYYHQKKQELSEVYFGDTTKYRKYLHLVLDFLIKIYLSDITLIFPLIYMYKRRTTVEIENSHDSSIDVASEGGTIIDSDDDDDYQQDLHDHQIPQQSQDEEIKESEIKQIINIETSTNYNRDKVSQRARELLKENMKREIIHAILLAPAKNKMAKIKKRTQKLYNSSKKFEQVLLDITDRVQQSTTSKDQQMSFTLKQEYLQLFDPYYYYEDEEFHKAQESIKSLKNERSHLNDYLGSYQYNHPTAINQQIGLKYAKCENLIALIVMIVGIYSNKQFMEMEVKALDAQILNDSLKLFAIIMNSVVQGSKLDKEQFVNAVGYKYFPQLQDSFLELSKQIPELKPNLIILLQMKQQILNTMGLRKVVQSTQEIIDKILDKNQEEQKTDKDQQKNQQQSEDWKKEAARLKKEEIMNKFKNKRSNFISKQQESSNINMEEVKQATAYEEEKSSQFSNNDQNQQSRDRINSEDHFECAYCREILNTENFFENPYGQFAYISSSKLMYHSINQTIEAQKLIFNDQDALLNQEEDDWVAEEEGYAKIRTNYVKDLQPNFLVQEDFTGGTLIKCSHYAHSKCLSKYIETQENDEDMRKERKILGLGQKTHQCPLCKQLSNILLPADDLSSVFKGNVQINILQNKQVSQIYTELYKFIFKNQSDDYDELDEDELLTTKSRLLFASVQKFIEHRIQQIDLKGLDEFINSKIGGLKDYSKLNKISKNTQQILKIMLKNGEQDQEKLLSEQTQKLKNSGLINLDISSFLISVISLGYQSLSSDKFNNFLTEQLRIYFNLQKLQSLIRALYLQNLIENQSNGLINLLEQIKGLRGKSNFSDIILQNQQLKDNYEDSLTQFTNKISGFLLLLDEKQEQVLKESLNFIPQDYIRKVLQIKEDQDLFSCELQEGQQFQEMVNVFLEGIIEEIQTQVDNKIFKIQVPLRFWLMTSKFTFNFIDLAPEFQSMVLQFYKLKCRWCKTQPQSSVVCLLCGEILCFIQSCCYDREGLKNKEGELTYHSRVCEGKTSIFLDTQIGLLYLIEKKRSSERPSPYLNKYGEHYSIKNKKYDNFYLDQKYGGLNQLENYKKMYMDFTLCNQVLKDRSSKTNYYRAGRM
eukprot:403368557